MRKFSILLTACAGLLLVTSPGATQAPERYKVRLTTVPMDGGMRNTVAGSGSGTATLAGAKLSVAGDFRPSNVPATSAKLNSGAARGVRGNAIADLTVTKSTKGSISGAVDLTADQLKGLRDGHLYIEVASERAPEGNLWGWILK